MERKDLSIRKRGLHDPEPDDYADLTPAERMGVVWRLTLDAWAFGGWPRAEP